MMNNRGSKKKLGKSSKQESSGSRTTCKDTVECPKRRYPLIAKDSEWVDILESSGSENRSLDKNDRQAGEEIIPSVQAANNDQIKPMALMFPLLLEEDPETLERIINKAVSTTDVTKHLVGQKADFTFLKKVQRLLPPNKKWLESLRENSNSCSSIETRDSVDDQSCSTEGRPSCIHKHYIGTKALLNKEINNQENDEDFKSAQSSFSKIMSGSSIL